MRRWWLTLILFGAVGASAQRLPVVEVYKSPSCECCKHWIRHLEEQGFPVRAINTDEVVRHKYRLGVPPGYGSCHTAEVAGYVIEGHVPAREIKRLLKERPKARGLTVPGMPIGSPGMEQGSRRDPYEVLLITPQGGTRVYARY